MAIMFTSSCTDQLTFVVTDVEAPSDMSEKRVQRMRDEVVLTEVNLLLSDNYVRLNTNFRDDETETIILQKIDDELYRADSGSKVVELELNTVFGYVRSCEITLYGKYSGSSMERKWTMILERK